MSNRDIQLNTKNVNINEDLRPLLINPNSTFSYVVNNQDFKYNPSTNTLKVPNVELTNINGSEYISGGSNVSYTEQYNDYDRYPNVIGYYDFSNKDNLGFDSSGNELHLINNGVEWVGDRGGSILFKNAYDDNALTWTAAAMIPTSDYIGLRYLEGKNNINKIKSLNNYSISIWILPRPTPDNTTRVQTFFSLFTIDDGYYLKLYWTNNILTLAYSDSRGEVVKFNYNANEYRWYHFVFTNDSNNGNNIFVDGVEQDYNIPSGDVGDKTIVCNISNLNATHFTLGAEKSNSPNNLYKYPLILSQIGDLMIFDDAIVKATVDALYADNYGYDVVIVAGQSNGVGFAIKGKTIEDVDYTNLQNKVYQYNTFYQIKKATPNIIDIPPAGWYKIEPAFNPLLHPHTGTFSGDSGPFVGIRPSDPFNDVDNTLVKIGFWKTFADRYIKSFKKSKRKLLLLPVAEGGKGFVGGNDEWKVGAGYLPAILRTALNDIKNIPLTRVVGMIWNQGETDISLKNSNYKTDFQELLEYIRTETDDFFASDTPVIMTKITVPGKQNEPDWAEWTIIFNSIVDELKAENQNIGFVDTVDLNWESQYHYDVDATRKLGIRYYKELVRILNIDYEYPDLTEPLLTVDGDVKFKQDLRVNGILTTKDIITENIQKQIYSPYWRQGPVIKAINFGNDGFSNFTQNHYLSGVLAENGYVYIIPAGSRYIIKFDYKTDTYKKIGINSYINTTGNNNEITGGCFYAPNGKIYCPPRDGNKILVIDTNNDDIYTLALNGYTVIPNGFGGICLGPDSKLYLIPNGNTNKDIWTIDYRFDLVEKTNLTTTTGTYNKALYHPYSNKMFLFNFNGTTASPIVGVIDFNIDEASRIINESEIVGLVNSIFGACIGVDGMIYGVGYSFTGTPNVNNIYQINPYTFETAACPLPDSTTVGVKIKATTIFQNPDGFIYIIPSNHSYFLRISPGLDSTDFPNPTNVTILEPPYNVGIEFTGDVGAPRAKTSGAIILPDGRTLLLPNVGTTLYLMKPLKPAMYPNWMMDPYNNFF